MKICGHCHKEKEDFDFYKKIQKDFSFKLSSWCRSCNAKEQYKYKKPKHSKNYNRLIALDDKYCLECKETKSPVSFNSSTRPNGKVYLSQKCKICTRNEQRNLKYTDFDKYLKKKNYQSNYHKRAQVKSYKLYQNYGITIEEFEEIRISQNNKCLICKIDFNLKEGRKKDSPCVDHLHNKDYKNLSPKQKKLLIRGLLCSGCNTGLGLFREQISNLEQAIEFLKKDKRHYVD